MVLYLLEAALVLLAFFTGSCIFSFLNVIVFRVPKKMSFVKGFSMCPSCGHRLGVLDLIPVWSYLFLRGKCRYCGEKIGARDTWIEVFGGAAAVYCVWRYVYENGNIGMALLVFAFIGMMSVVTFLDIDTMEIENGCHLAVLVLAVFSVFIMPEVSIVSRLIGAVCVSVPMLVMTLVIPGAFGGGDIKLMAACGLFLGWKLTLVSAALAILGGGIWGIYLMASKKKSRKEHFAFGPFLCLGMVLGLLWGEEILNWYLGFLQL